MHLMAVEKSRKRYGFVIFSCFKRDWVHLQQLKEMQSSRYEEGVPFVNRMYTKVLPFQYAGQELLKSLSQNKTQDLSLKHILIQVLDQRGQQ